MTDAPVIKRVLACGTHGTTRWQGHIICDNCGQTYQTRDEAKPDWAPAMCRCGLTLMPPASEAVGEDLLGMHGNGVFFTAEGEMVPLKEGSDSDWMARPICYLCFRKIKQRFGGRIPDAIMREGKARRSTN